MFLSGSVMLLRSTSAGTLSKNKKKRQEKMKEMDRGDIRRRHFLIAKKKNNN